jgi:hypothetical protein
LKPRPSWHTRSPLSRPSPAAAGTSGATRATARRPTDGHPDRSRGGHRGERCRAGCLWLRPGDGICRGHIRTASPDCGRCQVGRIPWRLAGRRVAGSGQARRGSVSEVVQGPGEDGAGGSGQDAANCGRHRGQTPARPRLRPNQSAAKYGASVPPTWSAKAVPPGPGDQGGAVIHRQLGEDVVEVDLDRRTRSPPSPWPPAGC